MFSRLLVLFIVVPLIELSLLIELGKVIGFWPTIAIICITGLIGSTLAKQQGLSVWTQFNTRMQKGELPGTELIDGLIILVSAAFLLTPGILTDVVGFMGLIPVTRGLFRKVTRKYIDAAKTSGSIRFNTTNFNSSVFGQQNAPFGQQGAPQPASPEAEPQWQGTGRHTPENGNG